MSTFAEEVDRLYDFILATSLVVAALVIGTMLFFAWRYRRRPGVAFRPRKESLALEIAFIVAPLPLLGFLFHAGFSGYLDMAIAPVDALEIRVVATQWSWTFEHPDGFTEVDELHVPVGRPVKLVMSSGDVLHSAYVPAFRVKRDIVPGMFTSLWFEATTLTEPEAPLPLLCTTYCGAPRELARGAGSWPSTSHATMRAAIHVVDEESYGRWLTCTLSGVPHDCADLEGEAASICLGRHVFESAGCHACHATHEDGAAMSDRGPPFHALWGTTRELVDGARVLVDESYIRESILLPDARIARGYAPGSMPPYRLADRQIRDLSAYIRSLAR